jgi:deoxyribodipyrimidine photo-lyase
MEVQIVWFKRDLRTADHAALTAAAARGPLLPLHVFEPALWDQPTMSGRQWAFVTESLAALDADLRALGTSLWHARGDMIDVLESLRRHYGAIALWSHEETGDAWTFARDRRVAAWARGQGVQWTELPQAGVIRRLRTRDGWARRWEAAMARAVLPPPRLTPATRPPAADFDPALPPDPCEGRQPGGRPAGRALLDSFLATRGRDYRRAMSSPVTAFDACSRLSPHLAWGTLSTREVAQAARTARASATGPRAGSLDSFLARLHWRCHFMQKLEDEPALEHCALHPALDDLGRDADPARLDAWIRGETGLPLVDACQRALAATGWLNFRMRAMVASVAAYHLWLDWRAYGPPLARVFTDYEPGIHWPQLQMQAGTTGINTTRIYNPVKQQLDHDPQGSFVRHWCPELARVPLEYLHQPWRMDRAAQAAAGCHIGRDYPAPIVDPVAAARAARDRIHAPRRGAAFRSGAEAVVAKHASRKRSGDRDMPRRARHSPGQLALDL